MQACEDHDDCIVVYTGNCPVCAHIDELETEAQDRDDYIDDLENQIAEMNLE